MRDGGAFPARSSWIWREPALLRRLVARLSRRVLAGTGQDVRGVVGGLLQDPEPLRIEAGRRLERRKLLSRQGIEVLGPVVGLCPVTHGGAAPPLDHQVEEAVAGALDV